MEIVNQINHWIVYMNRIINDMIHTAKLNINSLINLKMHGLLPVDTFVNIKTPSNPKQMRLLSENPILDLELINLDSLCTFISENFFEYNPNTFEVLC